MPGLRFKFKPFYAVTKHPWVQVPAGQIGVVIAQVGKPTPIGAKSARYDSAFGNFTDFRTFVLKNGEKGVQRPVLSPGTLAPIHPVAFLVITKPQVFGVPVSDEYKQARPRTASWTSAPSALKSGSSTSRALRPSRPAKAAKSWT